MTAPFAGADEAEGIRIDRELPCTHVRLWEALTNPEELSRWMGGPCGIEPWPGGAVRFDLESDGVTATGVVRACDAPRPDHRAALLEHTFVDSERPNLTSVCRWLLSDLGAHSQLHFTHDGFDRRDRNGLVDAWSRRIGDDADHSDIEARRTTTMAEAAQVLAAARTVLLVSFIGPEVPVTLVDAGFTVLAKTGPDPDAWARCEVRGGELRCIDLDSAPEAVDLVHLDVDLAFDEYIEVAVTLGATTFWHHSARTRPPEPADNRGCWVPPPQSRTQRRAAENAGLTYIDDIYIVDAARSLVTR